MNIEVGSVYHKLTVVKEIDRVSKYKRRFLCKCECGNFKELNLTHLIGIEKTKSCGCSSKNWHRKNFGENSPTWKGGKRTESNGYVEIYNPKHPKARANGYVKEHRLVMEKFLKRPLLNSENIHHINGNKSDNRIENLELWNTSQPSGQRAIDKIEWAKQILKLYKIYYD